MGLPDNSSGEIDSSFSQNDNMNRVFSDSIPVPVLVSTRDVYTRNKEEELSSGYNSYSE